MVHLAFPYLAPATLPNSFSTLQVTLRPYQQEGVNWLAFLRRFGLHGVLADDMVREGEGREEGETEGREREGSERKGGQCTMWLGEREGKERKGG